MSKLQIGKLSSRRESSPYTRLRKESPGSGQRGCDSQAGSIASYIVWSVDSYIAMPLPLIVAALASTVEAHTGVAGGVAAGSAAVSAFFLRKKPRQPATSTAELLAAIEGLDKRVKGLSADPIITTQGTINEAVSLIKAQNGESGLLRWIAGLKPQKKSGGADGGSAAADDGSADEEGAAEAFELLLDAYARAPLEDALEFGHVFALESDGVVTAVTVLQPVRAKEAAIPLALPRDAKVSAAVKRRLGEYNTVCARQLRTSTGANDGAFLRLSSLAVAPRLASSEDEAERADASAMLSTMAKAVQKIADGQQVTVCGHLLAGTVLGVVKRFQFGVSEELMLGAFGTDPTFGDLRAVQRTPYKVLKATPRSLEYKIMVARKPPPLKVLKANPSRFKGAADSDEE
jgi:hypothetical protein